MQHGTLGEPGLARTAHQHLDQLPRHHARAEERAGGEPGEPGVTATGELSRHGPTLERDGDAGEAHDTRSGSQHQPAAAQARPAVLVDSEILELAHVRVAVLTPEEVEDFWVTDHAHHVCTTIPVRKPNPMTFRSGSTR